MIQRQNRGRLRVTNKLLLLIKLANNLEYRYGDHANQVTLCFDLTPPPADS